MKNTYDEVEGCTWVHKKKQT